MQTAAMGQRPLSTEHILVTDKKLNVENVGSDP